MLNFSNENSKRVFLWTCDRLAMTMAYPIPQQEGYYAQLYDCNCIEVFKELANLILERYVRYHTFQIGTPNTFMFLKKWACFMAIMGQECISDAELILSKHCFEKYDIGMFKRIPFSVDWYGNSTKYATPFENPALYAMVQQSECLCTIDEIRIPNLKAMLYAYFCYGYTVGMLRENRNCDKLTLLASKPIRTK